MAVDRRQALRERHRSEILLAARALIDERGGTAFSVDELAERADVARRTVFNHFGSSDGVVLALTEEVVSSRIQAVLDAPLPTETATDAAAVFDHLAAALRRSDLAPAVATIGRTLAGFDDERAHRLGGDAFDRVASGLRDHLLVAAPDVDPLDLEVLVASLMGAVSAIARHWLTRPGDRSDTVARAEWDVLLDRCIERVRAGYRS